MLGDNSILTKDRNSIVANAEKHLNVLSDAYYYKKKFLLGEGMNRDKMRHYKRLLSIFCSEQCEITEQVKKAMEGCLEYTDTVRTFTQVAQQYATVYNCTIDEAINCDNNNYWDIAEW